MFPAPTATPRPRWRRWLAIAGEAALVAVATTALALRCSVPHTASLADGNPASTAFIDLRRDQAEAANKPWKLRWEWRRLGRISRYLRAAVVFSEDANFYTHDGVDWNALETAFEHDLHGASVRGGSTITQQLAKNLYLSPSRSFLRKARELLVAFDLEDQLSKLRILELYLNVVEWGDGIFGAEAAARAWFGTSAASLTPAQAARLATALPNPITRAPSVRSAELTQKQVRLIRLFRWTGLVDAVQERTALDEVGAPDERVLPDPMSPDELDAKPAVSTPPTATPPAEPPSPPPALPSPPAALPSPPAVPPPPSAEPPPLPAAPPPPPPAAPPAPSGPVTHPGSD